MYTCIHVYMCICPGEKSLYKPRAGHKDTYEELRDNSVSGKSQGHLFISSTTCYGPTVTSWCPCPKLLWLRRSVLEQPKLYFLSPSLSLCWLFPGSPGVYAPGSASGNPLQHLLAPHLVLWHMQQPLVQGGGSAMSAEASPAPQHHLLFEELCSSGV